MTPLVAASVLALASAVEGPTAKPPTARELEDAVSRAIPMLVGSRESYAERKKGPKSKSGEPPAKKGGAEAREWPYEGVYRVDGEIPIGYRIGGTSIVATALVEASRGAPSDECRAAVLGGLDFVLAALQDPRMGPDFERGYDVRGWGHAYALTFLLRMRSARLVPEKRAALVDRAVSLLVERLQRSEIGGRGGWNYSRPMGDDSDASTFMTAPTLMALFEARQQGETVDVGVVERALATLADARLPTGAFQYGSDKSSQTGQGFEDVPGAIGRMAVCEVTLFLAERGDVERIRASIAAFFEHWDWLEKRRKQSGTHVAPYMIAPYYFFYAHRYVAQAIEFLPEGERAEARARLHTLLWKVRESSGGWNDRVFPRSESFGTAMTVLALLEPNLPRPAGWKKPVRSTR